MSIEIIPVWQQVTPELEQELIAFWRDNKAIVNEAADFAKESPEPPLEELWTDIYA